MYNFGRDEARLWRSTTPRPAPLGGSQVSLRSRTDSGDGSTPSLPRERAIDVPANFVAKPRRGVAERPDPAPPPPPEAAKKKKRRLPRLRIRFTRKKRSAHVEWPPEALEAAERAGSSSPPPSVAERPPRDPRVSRLAERPASGAGDDVTSSGLGSSWETGLSVCSSPALERPGLARHASLRRSERRTLRAGRGRSGSPGSDSFRRTVSCPDGLGWGSAETEHPAVPLPSAEDGQRAEEAVDPGRTASLSWGRGETEHTVVPLPPAAAGAETLQDHDRTANLGGNGDATASDTAVSVSAVSSSASPPGGPADRHTVSPSADPPTSDRSARPAPAGSVSVERTFAAQLAHLRPLAAGVRHYWRLRHEEERLGTFHVHEASVEFEQLPRNIQPFVLYHRPLVTEIKTFWAQKRKALRARARNYESANSAVTSEEYSEQYSERDGGAGGDGVGDDAVEIPVQRDDEAVRGVEPADRDSDSAVCRTDTATDSHGVSESVRSAPRPAPDVDTVRQVRADLDSLRPLQDFGYVLTPVTRSRPAPPRRARSAAVRTVSAKADESRGGDEQAPSGLSSDLSGEPERALSETISEAPHETSQEVPKALPPDLPEIPVQAMPEAEAPPNDLSESPRENSDPPSVTDPLATASSESGHGHASDGSDLTEADTMPSVSRQRSSPVIIPAPEAIVNTEKPTVATVKPATSDPAPHSESESPSAEDPSTAQPKPRPLKPVVAAGPIRACSLDSGADPGSPRSGPDSKPSSPDAADGERRAAELSRSASFASARSFWRSLQDLRPIQESDRLRKKVSFREQQVQRRQDPVAVFFRHLLHKSESSQEVSRPPPAETDGRGQPHRSTLPVEPRRRPAHTRSLPNAVVARVEPKPKPPPQRRWPGRPEEPSDRRWIQDPPLKEAADPPEPPSVRHLRQALGSKPVQPVAPYHLQRQAPATASSRRFIRPGVVRRLQAQFEDLARQH